MVHSSRCAISEVTKCQETRLFIVITCGISLLNNLLQIETFKRELVKFLGLKEHVDSKAIIKLLDEKRSLIHNVNFFDKIINDLVCNMLLENPQKYSAELNTVTKLLKKLNNVVEVKFQLLATDTGSCLFCARTLAKVLPRLANLVLGPSVRSDIDSIVSVKGLFESDSEKVAEALSYLVDRFARKVLKYSISGYEVYTVISGGLKLEIVYIATIASIAKSWIVYCPDVDSDVVILPPLPIEIDSDVVRLFKGEDVNNEKLSKFIRLGYVIPNGDSIKLREWVYKLVRAIENA